MKLTCTQEHLQRAVQAAARAMSARATMPILSYLLVSADDGATISGTDLELRMEHRLEATVHERGALALPGRVLADVAAQLPTGPVEIASEDGALTAIIRSAGVKFELPGMAAADFPEAPDGAAATPVASVPVEVLSNLVRSTVFAVSTDETRPFLTGVCVVIKDGTAEFVATDGGRLARRAVTLGAAESGAAFSEIIPARSMGEVARAAGQHEGPVSIGQVDRQVVFTLPGMRIASRVIAGQFPAYGHVIPKDVTTELVVDTEEFVQTLRRTGITARDSSHTIRLHAENGHLIVKSNTHDVGASEARVPVEVSGVPADIAFNGEFLLDGLQAVRASKTMLQLAGTLLPGVIRAPEDPSYTYVLAPVRVYG